MRSPYAPGFLLIGVASAAPGTAVAAGEDLVRARCSAGAGTVTAVSRWHTNPQGPWRWDKGTVVSLHERQVKLTGQRCEGTVSAFIKNGSQTKGPIAVKID